MERVTRADIEQMRTRGYDLSTIADAEARLMLRNRADELILRIDRVFDGVALDHGIGLWESHGIDNYCGQDELKRLRARDEKVDWRRIPVADLNHCHAAPSFLDARGLYFHAPAFLTAELRGEFKDDFICRLIYDSSTATEFRNSLTAEQRHAIIACISFYGSLPHYGYAPEHIAAAMLRYSFGDRD